MDSSLKVDLLERAYAQPILADTLSTLAFVIWDTLLMEVVERTHLTATAGIRHGWLKFKRAEMQMMCGVSMKDRKLVGVETITNVFRSGILR